MGQCWKTDRNESWMDEKFAMEESPCENQGVHTSRPSVSKMN